MRVSEEVVPESRGNAVYTQEAPSWTWDDLTQVYKVISRFRWWLKYKIDDNFSEIEHVRISTNWHTCIGQWGYSRDITILNITACLLFGMDAPENFCLENITSRSCTLMFGCVGTAECEMRKLRHQHSIYAILFLLIVNFAFVNNIMNFNKGFNLNVGIIYFFPYLISVIWWCM